MKNLNHHKFERLCLLALNTNILVRKAKSDGYKTAIVGTPTAIVKIAELFENGHISSFKPNPKNYDDYDYNDNPCNNHALMSALIVETGGFNVLLSYLE